MKKIISLVVMLMMLASINSISQDKKPLSPKETVKGTIDAANVEIVYCRPSARGRKMLGDKEPYGKVWRTGANAATTIKFDKAVSIEGKTLDAGTYALFTIPNENEWVIIFNKKIDQWGAYDYEKNKDQDALQVTVKPGKTPAFVETFTIAIDKDQVNLQWENTAVSFKVKG
jgi:hypothetical protein